jgi:hypothetical protein
VVPKKKSFRIACGGLMLLLLLVAGCQPQGAAPANAPLERMVVQTNCVTEVAAECELVVEVRALDDDVLLDVQTHADFGVRFVNNNEVATVGQFDGRIQNVRLRAQGSRLIHFPYQVHDARLPGEYLVDITTFHPSLPEVPEALRSEVYAEQELPVYVIMLETGEFRLVGSDAAFQQRYGNGYVPGAMGIDYRIILPDENAGQSGWLVAKVTSRDVDFNEVLAYEPTLEINAVDGIDFSSSVMNPVIVSADRKTASFRLPPMRHQESRVIAFPINVDVDGRQLDGVYTFIATISFLNRQGHNLVESERLPVGIQVVSDPNTQSRRIMAVQGITGAVVTPTADPNATVTSTPTTTPTPVPVVAVLGVGGVQPNPATSFPTPTPTLTPTPSNTDCRNLLTEQATYGRRTVSWEWQRTDLSGSLCQYYLTQVHNLLPISWEQFRGEALLYNPHLETDGEVFYPEKCYQLPEMEE